MAQLLIPHSTPARTRLRPGGIVDIVSPAPRDIWQGVLRDDPGATALQTPEYFGAVLAATGGEDASRLYQLRDGRQLVLPLVRTRSAPGLLVEAGFPGGFGHGGMLATGGLLADDVRTVLPDLQGRSLSLRIGGAHHTREQWSAGLRAGVTAEPRQVEVADLTERMAGGPRRFRGEQFSPGIQQRLRQAESAGVEIEIDTTVRLLPTFYDIYRAWLEREIPRSGLPPVLARRLTKRPEPYTRFATVAAITGETSRIFVAWHRGRPVATSMMLTYGQHATLWRSYCIDELATPVGADLLTVVAAMEDALRLGCRYVELDGSSPLHGCPQPVVDLRIEPAGLTRLRTAQERAAALLTCVANGPAQAPSTTSRRRR